MAYKTVATRWLLSLRSSLPVSFVEHKWGQPDITDIEVLISENGHRFSGRGTASIGDLALEKASSEAIERWCCHKLSLSTVGCAVHSDESRARKNAESEFIERFIFDSFIEKGGISRELAPIRLPLGDFRFWEVDSKIIVAMAFSKDAPIAIGMANEIDIKTAIEKSKMEALRNLSAFRHDPVIFRDITKNDPDFWCCEPAFLTKALKRLENSEKQINVLPQYSIEAFSVGTLLGFAECNLYFAKTKKMGVL